MPQKTVLTANGLYTDPNQLSSVPEGSLLVADNVIIDRDNVIESRRGNAKYGNEFGLSDADTAKQLINYKDRILIHYDNKLLFNQNEHVEENNGFFVPFDGEYTDTEPGLRIKSVESNRNLYFTTNDGIKKISAQTADDLTTAANFIVDAGAVKALDVTNTLTASVGGFLPTNSKVAYRVVWGYNDANNNLILGAPSSRLVVTNATTSSSVVNLEFTIPNNITSDYFYQVYRTAVFTVPQSLTLDDIDPGDEMNLIIEDTPASLSGTVTVTDVSPENFRIGGSFLYTNPSSGQGIDQSNDPPPLAKDITAYQSSTFYANTESLARTTITILSVDDFVSQTSSITIDDGVNPVQTYTFVGEREETLVDFAAYSGSIPTDLNGTYWLINSASNSRKYYVWYSTNKTTQLLNFANYIGNLSASPSGLDGEYVLINTASDRGYYVWYDGTGTTEDPGNTNTNLAPYTSVRVDLSALGYPVTKAQLASATTTALTNIDTALGFNDFDVEYNTSFTGTTVTSGTPTQFTETDHELESGDIIEVTAETGVSPSIIGTHVITKIDKDNFSIDVTTSVGGTADFELLNEALYIRTDEFNVLEKEEGNTIGEGFIAVSLTPINEDPANTPGVNTDVVGRTGIEVNVSRNISSKDELADATAAAIQDQDEAIDFYIDYTNGDEDLTIINTNNGNTDDAIDSGINGLGNSFSIMITTQGDGEDSSNNDVLLSATQVDGDPSTLFAPTPAQAIDETARSLVNIINKNSSESVTAFYLSGANDLPGEILLEARDIGTVSFTVEANDATTGAEFNPALPPATGASTVSGSRESNPNRIFFSKIQQPEAVPIVNFIDVGPKDKEISRIIALRESLFILKEDGVYRLTGIDGNFVVDLFDESTKIIAPDTAVVLNNQILCLTNQGVAQISDTGIEIISKQLDNVINTLINPRFDFRLTSFGVSYETDRAYWLWLPTIETDTVATQAFRYNTFTRSWTRAPLSKTCGLVNSGDNKLYLGAADQNFVERERKNLNRRDYADRENDYSIVANGVNGKTVTLSQSNIASVGDSIVQTQYLTIDKFNQILKKLDSDNFVNDSDYFSNLEMIIGNSQVDKLDSLALKLDNDTGVVDSDYLTSLDDQSDSGVSVSATNPAVINSVGHGLNTGRVVTISNSTTTPNIDGNYTLSKIDNDNFSINVSVTVAGTCNYQANINTLEEVQGGFNTIVNKLNLDAGVLDTNYPLSEGVFDFESLVSSVTPNSPSVELFSSLPFVEGPITLYESIPCTFLYVPETFGDPSLLKQVSECTIVVQDNTFTGGVVGHKTDQSAGIEETSFSFLGKGDFGFFNWSSQNWGGGFAQAPVRVYVPRNKQRCRQIQAQFRHSNAREIWAVYGYSYTFRGVSERAYRR